MTATKEAVPSKRDPEPSVVSRSASLHERSPGMLNSPSAGGLSVAGNLALQHMLTNGGIQAKLAVSQPEDEDELQADRTADEAIASRPLSGSVGGCSECSQSAPCTKCHQEEQVKRKASTGNRARTSLPAESSPDFLKGGGQPLPLPTRNFFEPFFRHDFRDVRVHTDDRAAQSAQAIKARAFAAGSNLVFGPGQYNPDSREGRWLIAHELAHVAQPRSPDRNTRIHRQPLPSSGGERSPPTQGTQGDPATAAQRPEVELRPPAGSLVLWFRGVPLADDTQFVRQEMYRLISTQGLERADSWYRAVQGNPDATYNLPFSAHARAYGGLRVRSPLDARRDFDQEQLRVSYAPIVARIYPEVREEASNYLRDFESRARAVTLDVLRDSEARVEAERIRYGLTRQSNEVRTYRPCRGDRDCATTTTVHTHGMRATGSSEGLIGAARDLQAKQTEINDLMARRNQLVERRTFGREREIVEHITDRPRYDQLTTQAQEKRREYDLMLALFQQRYPILASYANDPAGISRIATAGISPTAAGVLNQQIYDTLDNIASVRAELVPGGEVDIWKLPEIVHLTKVATGAVPETLVGRMRARVVDDEAQRLAERRRWTNIAIAVLAIGLAILAAIPSGGSSLIAGASAIAGIASAGLSIGLAAQHLREFQLEQAMTGTDFDRARAISTEEPSLFWLAVDILGAALEVGPALRGTMQLLQVGQRSFRALAGATRRALTAARGADAAESLAALRLAAEGAEFGGARLAARLEESVQRVRQAGGSAERAFAGAAGHEAGAAERAAAALARDAEHALARVPTRLGDHTVKVTPGGWLVRCTACGQLREEFAVELARNHDLAQRVFATEERAARAARTGNAALAEQAAQEGRQLADELEAFRRTREIRLYRGLPEGAIEDIFLMDRRLVVDMPFVGRGAPNTNSAGWMRDAGYYWEELARRHPDAFSPDNLRRIQGAPPLAGPVSPINDAQFRSVFTQYDVQGLRSQPLIHHHVGGGGQAAAIPAPLHPGSGGVHNVERAAGIWGAEDPIADMLQRLLNQPPPGG